MTSSFRYPALAILLALPPTSGCVAYESEAVSLHSAAASLPHHTGTLTFAEAVAMAFAQNAGLQALAAEVRAAGADVMPTELQGELRDERIAVTIDPFALLGLTQRGASAGVAEAKALEAAAALAEARWRVTGAIAEVFVRQRALASLQVPQIQVDVDAFAAAGLASPIAAEQVRAAAAGADAEQRMLAAENAMLQAELRGLLGLASTSGVQLVLPAEDWPPLLQADEAAVLGRPDLAVALAMYRTADAEFRKAVADQYPSLMLGPDLPLRSGTIDPMALVRLPLGAAGPAAAARERRQAARARLVDAVASATNEAEAADIAWQAAVARERATQAAVKASFQALAAATAAVQVEVDAFERLAETAPMAVRDAMEAREAALAKARARVRRAVTAGWPATGVRP